MNNDITKETLYLSPSSYGKHMIGASHSICSERLDNLAYCDGPVGIRIVASWNATEGISTSALESGVVAEMVQVLERARDELNSFIALELCDKRTEEAAKFIYNLLAKLKSQ